MPCKPEGSPEAHCTCNNLYQEQQPIKRSTSQRHPPVAALDGRCLHRGAPFAHIEIHKLAVVLPCANQTGVLQGDKGMGNHCRRVQSFVQAAWHPAGEPEAASNRSSTGRIGIAPFTKVSFEASRQLPGLMQVHATSPS